MSDPSGRASAAWPLRLSVALLALVAAWAAQAQLPVPIRAPLGFLLMGVIPGWLLGESLLRAEGTTREERAMASLVLSVPVTIVGRTLAFLGHVPTAAFPWIWAGLCTVWALSLRPRAHRSPPADPAIWVLAAGFGLMVALPASIDSVIRHYGDAMFHAGIINQIRFRGIPPDDPSFIGFPLNYMWQVHVWAAALADTMGLSPFGVFQWIGGAMMASIVFGVYRLACLFWPERFYRRLAPAVVVLGMNALGWLLMVAYFVVDPFVGKQRGLTDLLPKLQDWILHPSANLVCMALIYNAYFVIATFLFKFICVSAQGTALALIMATVVLVAVRLSEGGRGRLVAIMLTAMMAPLVHPVVAEPAIVAVGAGAALAAFVAGTRRRAIESGLAVAAGLVLGIPVVWLMVHQGLVHGEPIRVHFIKANVPGIVQTCDVVILPAIWGWMAVRRRSSTLALLGLGFALACLVFALTLDPPTRFSTFYLIYAVYLSVALFAPAGIGALIETGSRRIGKVPTWTLAALVFLPSTLLVLNGFSRNSTRWGLAGYPETADEIAVFDYVRDHTPIDAVVIDLPRTACSAVTSYSGRRGYYGGFLPAEAASPGYPRDIMAMRERVVANLLYGRDVSDSTWQALRAIPAPLYVVARRIPTKVMVVDPPPGPWPDATPKLDAMPGRFQSLFRTKTIVLYRVVRDGAAAPVSSGGSRGSS
jgi:hypothetical protein